VKRQYKAYKQRVKKNVSEAQSKIYISCDLWTSINDLLILIVIFYYVDKNGNIRRTIISIKEVDGSHIRENLSVLILIVIKEWSIQDNLGYFIMDNIENNDIMMKSIALSKGPCP